MTTRTMRLSAGMIFGSVIAASLGNAPNAEAMPMFSRKLGVQCNFCHTTIPRLNEVGYKFRAAGFRLIKHRKGGFCLISRHIMLERCFVSSLVPAHYS
jgi:hypothetical protein